MKILVALLGALVALSLSVAAQSFNPVIEENSVDGLLVGAEGSYPLLTWLEPSLGLAYGLQSQKIRYKAGISLWDLVTVSALDWPRTAVLGRTGESGLKATLKLPWGLPTLSGFFGTLWPWTEDPHSPNVAYVLSESGRSFQLPFGIELRFSQRTFLGWWQLGVLPSELRYSQTSLSLRYNALSLNFSYGNLENKSNFPEFIFVQGVKGESSTLKGDQFWSVHFERAFDVMTMSVPVPLLPQSLELLVQGGVFAQVSNTSKIELPSAEQEGRRVWRNLLSWGLSLMFALDKMGAQVRADFVFTRDGQFHSLLSF